MALYVTLAALLLGVGAHVEVAGRVWTLSYIDAVAVGLGVAGTVVAWRRRRVRLDVALLAYAGVLGVVAVQAITLPEPAAVIGGSSRFVVAALVLFGLEQLLPVAASTDPTRRGVWRPASWPQAYLAFSGVLAVLVVVSLIDGLASSEALDFYAVKKTIELPLGASNYLAAFLAIGAAAALPYVDRGSRWPLLAGLSVLGLLATLSRGAFLAFAVVAVVAFVAARHDRRVWVRGGVAVGAAAASFVAIAVAASTFAQAPDQPSAPVAGESATDAGTTTGEATPEPDGDGGPTDSALGEDGPVVASNDGTDERPGIDQLEGALTTAAAGGRRQLYRASWEAFADQPLLGVGLNRLDTYTGRGGHPPHVNAHNLLLHALATTGLLGAAVYLFLWFVVGRRLWHLPRGPHRAALLLGVGALLLHAQVEALTYTRAIEVVLATVLAVASTAPGAVGVQDVTFGRARSTPVGGG